MVLWQHYIMHNVMVRMELSSTSRMSRFGKVALTSLLSGLSIACVEGVDQVPPGDPLGECISIPANVTYAEAAQVLNNSCVNCHSSELVGAARNGAPEGSNYDGYENASARAQGALARMQRAAGEQGLMPPNGPADACSIRTIELWVAAGTPDAPPGDGPGDNDGDQPPVCNVPDQVYFADVLRETFNLDGGDSFQPCVDCHGPDRSERNIRYDSFEGASVDQVAEAGLAAIIADRMPPGFADYAETTCGDEFLDAWIDGGKLDEPDDPEPVTYQQVQPIINQYCSGCHVSRLEGDARNGAPPNSNFETYELASAAINGIIARSSSNGDNIMPPGNLPKVTPDEIAILQAWSDQGTPDVDVLATCGIDGNVSFDDVAFIFTQHNCLNCHSALLEDGDRNGAPVGSDFDTEADVGQRIGGIITRITDGSMPPNDNDVDVCDIRRLEAWNDGGRLASACVGDEELPTQVTFVEAQPVFAEQCIGCHSSELEGDDRNNAPGAYNYDDFDGATANGPAGNAAERAYIRMAEIDGANPMPPAGVNNPNDECETATIQRWFQAGALEGEDDGADDNNGE